MTTPAALIDAFAAAVEVVLRETAGVDAARRDTITVVGDTTVALRLDGDASRWAILALPRATAAALARRVLAGVGGEPDDALVRDCAAELLNVAAGQAKALLSGTPFHFTFTTPAAPPGTLTGEGAAVGVVSGCGPFTLRLRPAAGDGPGG